MPDEAQVTYSWRAHDGRIPHRDPHRHPTAKEAGICLSVWEKDTPIVGAGFHRSDGQASPPEEAEDFMAGRGLEP